MEYVTVVGCAVFVLFLVFEARQERRDARQRRQRLADADRRRRVAARAYFGND